MMTFLSDHPWRMELKEVIEPTEDLEETILQQRIIVRPGHDHVELRIWYENTLVFYMSTDPDCEAPDIPNLGSVHMFVRFIDQELPLLRLLRDANRAQNAGN